MIFTQCTYVHIIMTWPSGWFIILTGMEEWIEKVYLFSTVHPLEIDCINFNNDNANFYDVIWLINSHRTVIIINHLISRKTHEMKL